MSDIDLTQYPKTVEAFGGNGQRATVFLDRYSMKDKTGKPFEQGPAEMFARVARAIAGDEDRSMLMGDEARSFFNLLDDFKFVPGGRILSGAGTGTEVTYYNCYVIPVETKARRQSRGTTEEGYVRDKGNDSREAIIDTIGVMVDIMSRGGGVGINWSVLRPAGAHLKRINATSSGPIDWMHFASVAVGTVEQGGSRRGAAMFMLDDWHPDVLSFIEAKRDETRITNANVSVCVSDEFMRRVEQDLMWNFCFPDTSAPEYDTSWDGDMNHWLDRGLPVKMYGSIKARELWRKLAEAAHASGEPGVVFLDRYNKQSTAKGYERIISVNPCGEQGLGPYSVCNLGAMNLSAYVSLPTPSGQNIFDLGRFATDVATAVRFLDKVIDSNYYFLPENELVQKDLRRIGLGVMGLADALIKLRIRYGSPEAVAFTEEVFRTMKHAAIGASAELARELGPAPLWKDTMRARPYLDDLLTEEFGGDVYEMVGEHGLRNLFLLTQAPTGTTSILAGVNSGIEPLFDLGYWREDRTGKHWVEPAVVAQHKAIDGYCDLSCDFLVTADKVTVEEHIAMQAAAQKYVDSSISKTINAPNDQTVEEVEKAYTLAYKSGLKGLAYYRDGSRQEQVLRRDKPENTSAYTDEYVDRLIDQSQSQDERIAALEAEVDRKESVILDLQGGKPYTRPGSLTGRTHRVKAGMQTAYVTVNRQVGPGFDRPIEVFVSVGKSGTEMMSMGEAIGRLISVGLQKGLSVADIVDQLEGVGNNGLVNRSLPSAIAEALTLDAQAEAEGARKFDEFVAGVAGVLQTPPPVDMESSWGTETEEWAPGEVDGKAYAMGVDLGVPGGDKTVVVTSGMKLGDLCPECGNLTLRREEGCQKCPCGYSAC